MFFKNVELHYDEDIVKTELTITSLLLESKIILFQIFHVAKSLDY